MPNVGYMLVSVLYVLWGVPSACGRKASAQRLLRCRFLFCLSLVSCKGSGFAAGCTVVPKMHCCLQFLKEKGKSCCSAVSSLPSTGEERLNHAWWQGETMAVTSSGLCCAAVVAACSGGRARESQDPAPCAGSCYVLQSGRPVAGKCTCQQSVMPLRVGNEVSVFPCNPIPHLPAPLHFKLLFSGAEKLK